MKKDNKKALYESIMASVAKEVKKVLNEDEQNNSDVNTYINNIKNVLNNDYKDWTQCINSKDFHNFDQLVVLKLEDTIEILENMINTYKCDNKYSIYPHITPKETLYVRLKSIKELIDVLYSK